MGEPAAKHEDPGLYMTEAQIARELGIPYTKWKTSRGVFEGQGMRRRDPILGLRYWPAVKAFFDHRNGLDKIDPEAKPVKWGENLDALRPRRTRTHDAA